jgi:hypothetical protein
VQEIMAGEWIKIERSTMDKPEILRVARILGIDKDAVLGKLIRLWAWFDVVSVDGVVDGVVESDIDTICSQSGLSAALVSVGWLAVDNAAAVVSIPKFARHNGESAKKRALKSEAQARWRAKKGNRVDGCESTRESTNTSTREEKRREESKQTPLPPSRKRGAVEFKTWMDSCKAAGEKPISEYRAIFDYAESIRLPVDFLQLAWAEFSRRHSPGGVDCRKKKSDWRAYFRKAVEGNWYHLWFHDVSTDQFSLTSNGRAAERATA